MLKLYNIGDKLTCIESINAQCLDMENPNIDIQINDTFVISEKEEYPTCHWYEIKSDKYEFSVWNDEGHAIINDCFKVL